LTRRIVERKWIWAARVSAAAVVACAASTAEAQVLARVASPDGKNEVTVELKGGGLRYAVRRNGMNVLMPSALGFEFRNAPKLKDGLRLVDIARATHDTTWTQPWGEVRRVRDHHNELRVSVVEAQAPGRRFVAVFRVFDDGLGFRYELPQQAALRDFEIMEELTEFAMASNGRAWWIPSFQPERYELLFRASPLSTLDTVHTPLTMELVTGQCVVIHEADLTDYAGLNIGGGKEKNRTLRVVLAPMNDGVKVRGQTPFATPWRTIQLADRAADLAPSVLGLNLNLPSRIADPSWVVPMKYDGIWWGMHVNTMTWEAGPKHGATTANAKRYIDFAAGNHLGGFLVEGWNLGWENWQGNGDRFSFTRAYPDYDFGAVAAYAKEKGVRLIGHNETAMGIENYERQMEDAFKLYQSLGITAVKTGYVGDKTKEGHAHHSQYMVRHYRKVIETAARYHIAIDAHEPIHDTGERRTWPNMVTREGARGQEYNAWGGDGGNPPEHETILFFTRMLAGPFDFTPGIFDIGINRPTGTPRPPEASRPRTTLAKQLALYVVLYSPLQMAADLPENYQGQPAFQFIRDVAVDWDTTRVLEGKIGDYVIVARKAKVNGEWFIGAISDEEERFFDVPLSFLPPGTPHVAEIYADGPGAHYLTNPTAVAISTQPVTAASRLTLRLAPGGGQAIRFRPAKP
jgi:alpha-glucosidase